MNMKTDDIKSIIPIDKVYTDALSPALKQIGQAIESVAKTSRFLLAPIDFLAAQHDRWQRHLVKVASKVESKNLIEGHHQIVIPTLEGLSLTGENTLLSEFFINLLANSIDKTKQDFAHPAFPNIIKQLSHDEAVILFYLKKKNYKFKNQSDWIEEKRIFTSQSTITEEFPMEKLNFPKHILLYMNHLASLNLAGTFEYKNQEVIKDPSTQKQTGVYINYERTLIEFGELFAMACVPEKFEEL